MIAFAQGDTENFVAASTPGGIEAQEKRGQLQQATQQTLPIEMGTFRYTLESLGFSFGENADDLFINAIFPEGWRKEPTDHSMWTDLIDGKGRKRGSIFYKAAFYDRSSYLTLNHRFSVRTERDHEAGTRTIYVQDRCEEVVKRSEPMLLPDWQKNRKEAEERLKAAEAMEAELAAWLDKEWPDWKIVTAYWD